MLGTRGDEEGAASAALRRRVTGEVISLPWGLRTCLRTHRAVATSQCTRIGPLICRSKRVRRTKNACVTVIFSCLAVLRAYLCSDQTSSTPITMASSAKKAWAPWFHVERRLSQIAAGFASHPPFTSQRKTSNLTTNPIVIGFMQINVVPS